MQVSVIRFGSGWASEGRWGWGNILGSKTVYSTFAQLAYGSGERRVQGPTVGTRLGINKCVFYFRWMLGFFFLPGGLRSIGLDKHGRQGNEGVSLVLYDVLLCCQVRLLAAYHFHNFDGYGKRNRHLMPIVVIDNSNCWYRQLFADINNALPISKLELLISTIDCWYQQFELLVTRHNRNRQNRNLPEPQLLRTKMVDRENYTFLYHSHLSK